MGKIGKTMRRRRTDSPRRRKKCKCKNVQRVTRQRCDQTRRSCASESPHSASKTQRLPTHRASCNHWRPATGGTRPTRSHLVPLPLGGQVGQTAAGHRSELPRASLAVAILASPSFAEPGEEQARRHGADRTRRGDSTRPVRQLTARASPGRHQRKKTDHFFF